MSMHLLTRTVVLLLLSAAAGVSSAAAGELADGVAVINVAAADTGHGHGHAEDAKAAPTAHGEGEASTDSEGDGEPEPVRLWPEAPAVDPDQQPFVLVRRLRAVQDEIALGSAEAHEHQRTLMKELGALLPILPVAVWDDVRNVRAAIFFVLSGGNPTVLRIINGRPKSEFVERRVLRAALAYGEGRVVDAMGLMQKVDARALDPLLGGIFALIQGTLITKKDPIRAIQFFDQARLLSPGTLIEESALRQEILLIAKEGEVERFDVLSNQYARRFPNSLFAQSFRRHFFAGIARKNFKRAEEWMSRTERELTRVPGPERLGLYLAMAEEATKDGNLDVARFAAAKARELAPADSRSMQRAKLFEGAALAASEEYEQAATLLGEVDSAKISEQDEEIRSAALAVAGAVGKWPTPPQKIEEPVEAPGSVSRAEALLSQVDTLLGGPPQ
ncbi:MAG: hypothetical protein AB7S70_10055 [Hyphomicrobium sp.]|uniref:hypothetical protein n=1 Tax=Hyphomicrobium sp. TaxID=82 RepID=UPI003D105234